MHATTSSQQTRAGACPAADAGSLLKQSGGGHLESDQGAAVRFDDEDPLHRVGYHFIGPRSCALRRLASRLTFAGAG